MMQTPPRHAVPIILYAILAILVIPVFPHFVSPNEFSRWDLAVAIVDFHTIEVTRAVAATNTETEDLAEIDGRKYSNKAPGAALVGLPGYAVARWIVGPPSPHNMRVFDRLAKRVVLWDVNSYDWKDLPPIEVAQRVIEGARPGSIILMHDGGRDHTGTIEAVRLLVPELRARGFELVTVSRALAA